MPGEPARLRRLPPVRTAPGARVPHTGHADSPPHETAGHFLAQGTPGLRQTRPRQPPGYRLPAEVGHARPAANWTHPTPRERCSASGAPHQDGHDVSRTPPGTPPDARHVLDHFPDSTPGQHAGCRARPGALSSPDVAASRTETCPSLPP